METGKKEKIVGFRDDEDFVKQLTEAAKREDTSPSRSVFVRILMRWAFERYKEAGSLHALKKRVCVPAPPTPPKPKK